MLALLQSADETLGSLEKRIESAQTLTVRFTQRVDVAGRPEGTSHSGSLQVSRAGKVRYELQAAGGGLFCLFDGDRLKVRRGKDRVEDRGAPRNLKETVLAVLTRGGVGECATLLSWANLDLPQPKKRMNAREFRVDGDRLSFIFEPLNTPDNAAKVELLFDPKSFLFKKRNMEQDLGNLGRFVVTETYEDFKLDAEVPNDLFTWPADR